MNNKTKKETKNRGMKTLLLQPNETEAFVVLSNGQPVIVGIEPTEDEDWKAIIVSHGETRISLFETEKLARASLTG